MPSSPLALDTRDALEIMADLLARQPGYLPGMQLSDLGPGVALQEAFARYLQAILQRLNQAPYKNELAFFDMLGIELVPAQEARAPVVFQLLANAPDAHVPAGTRVGAPPPPGSQNQLVFETANATGVAAAKLTEVISLWPGRDQYLDHSALFLAGQPFVLFQQSQLNDTPHSLYLAHNKLLALAGQSNVQVQFDLTTPSSEPLDTVWEYWDGKVWRPFLAMSPSCDETEAHKIDGTSGFQRSGRWLLKAECAQTAMTTVNGVKAFWIRARLNETLPPNPARVLPEVETIKLSTELASPLSLVWKSSSKAVLPTQAVSSLTGESCDVKVKVVSNTGTPLQGVPVTLSWTPQGSSQAQARSDVTDAAGEACFIRVSPDNSNKTASIAVDEFGKSETFVQSNSALAEEVDFVLKLQALSPEKAFTYGHAVDVSKPFYPLGLQPQPGSAFYFTSSEIFSKPGAKFRVYVQRAQTPQDQQNVSGAGTTQDLLHSLSWEYWNGDDWISLLAFTNSPGSTDVFPDDFSGTGLIDLAVPDDWVTTKVNNQDGFWMRVRLLSGSFGFKHDVTWVPSEGQSNTFTYVISQPPAVSDFKLGYVWQYGPFHAEEVFSYNDFQYEDDTAAAKWPGNAFQPFKPVSDLTPAVYLGFDKPLPVDRLGIYFDIVEVRGDTQGPALVWEYFDGIAWQSLVVDDETRGFRVPGLASFIGPEDALPFARFDVPLYWLRARLKEDGPPGAPALNGIFPNAAWVVQQQTLTEETLGKSSGVPDQVMNFRQFPVLSGERVEVQELAGARANVEWRLLAREITGGDARLIAQLEAMLAEEGRQLDIMLGDLHLRRDRNKHVSEFWVRWEPRPHFFFSGPTDRHYVLDRVRGRLLFGDGTQGKIPPVNALVAARQYRTGGGLAGNVAKGTIKQLLAGIPGVQGVLNPLPAEGGANTETLDAYSARAPETLLHRGRAISAEDFETLAKQASPAVAVARAIPCLNASGNKAAGWVTLLIIPQSDEPRPWPSFGLREDVRKFVEQRVSGDLAAAHNIYVTGPDYLPVDVEATIVPLDPTEAGAVEQRVLDALQTFFHPLRGGPRGQGWDLGRGVYLSDVASLLEGVEGVDYVKEFALLLNGELQGDPIKVGPDRIVVAGDLHIKMLEP